MEWITPYFSRTMSILPPSHIVQSYDNMDFLKNITQTYYINGGGSLVAKLCPTLNLYDPMDCSPSGSSVHGISQAKILEWVAISFSR